MSSRASSSARLKLAALDIEGLTVLSAHLAGAEIDRRAMKWFRDERRFVFTARADLGPRDPDEPPKIPKRENVGCRFEKVISVAYRGLGDAERLKLEFVAFLPDEDSPPSGASLLVFDNGGAVRIQATCPEAALSVLSDDGDES